MDEILREVRAKEKRPERGHWPRYQRASSMDEARVAADYVKSWLDELACMPHLGHDGEHAVAEALRDLHAVRGFLRRSEGGAR